MSSGDQAAMEQEFKRLVELKIERVATWSGPVGIFVFFVGFWPVGRLMPVISPSASAAQLAAFYSEHALAACGSGSHVPAFDSHHGAVIA